MEKIKKILENVKFENKNAYIKFIQDFDEFKIFIVELNNSKDLSGKLTKDAIEYYGIDGDEFFDASEAGVNSLIEKINYEIKCGYKISFYGAKNQILNKVLFTSEDVINKNDASDICSEIINQNDAITSASFNGFSNNVSYEFSFKKKDDEIIVKS